MMREGCAGDSRGQMLKVTEEGCARLRSMWPVYRHAIATHFRGQTRHGGDDDAGADEVALKVKS